MVYLQQKYLEILFLVAIGNSSNYSSWLVSQSHFVTPLYEILSIWLDLIQCKTVENSWVFQLITIKKHFYSQLEDFQPCSSSVFQVNGLP